VTQARVGRLPGRGMTTVAAGRRLTVTADVAARDAVVVATGEVDAVSARRFADAVVELSAGCSTVLLDLRGLAFMALDGLAALHAIRAALLRADVTWAALPGPAVWRVLELCDPEQLVPTIDSASDSERMAV
jgi:anti-anti-sigma factor